MSFVKNFLRILALLLAVNAAVFLIIWLISKIAPILIGAIIFLPWLCAALKDGANV